VALAFGELGIAAGFEAVHYTNTVGPSGDDFTGLLAIAAGLLLLGLGGVTLWRTRRVEGNQAWRYGRRVLLAAAGVVASYALLLPVGLGYVTTHVGRPVVPANALGVAYENVSFTTSDGLELQGWYVPSKNGAAVISFPGRKGPQKPARFLARHGYGVLLFDRRGEGKSDGEPNSWGWGGAKDIKAAVAFLQGRPDVERGRIGGLGLSVGGEMMLEAAADTPSLTAVVSEGAGARMFTEEMDEDLPAVEKATIAVPAWLKQASIAVFANQSPPTNLKDLVPRIAPRPMLLIAAPNAPTGEDLNRGYFAAAGDPKDLWEIPESGHVGGQKARPREYERRVTTFFDRALLG
jgi:pimeloyl-ACP methyl ester carboxylesterase